MVYFKCSTCRIRLYSSGSAVRSLGDLCPGCRSLLEPVGELSDVGGFRSIESRDDRAAGTHQQIADRVDHFLWRRNRDDAERWLDDGGSFRGPTAACGRSEAKA